MSEEQTDTYQSNNKARTNDKRGRVKRAPHDDGTQWSKIFPQRLTNNYRTINVLLKSLKDADPLSVEKTAVDLESLLNNSMPQNAEEQTQRIQEFIHFHKDSEGYYQHLLESKLRFLVLWTDYKYITKHFRIRNIIHVRWNGTKYECQLYDQSKRIKYRAGIMAETNELATQNGVDVCSAVDV